MNVAQNTTDRHNGRRAGEAQDPEVMPKAKRRMFSAAYKRQIVEEADACTEPGEIGALLRREGLYSSHLSKWRQQYKTGTLGGVKRGRNPDPAAVEYAKLKAQNEKLQRELEKAKLIIDAQKKLVEVFGLSMQESEKP